VPHNTTFSLPTPPYSATDLLLARGKPHDGLRAGMYSQRRINREAEENLIGCTGLLSTAFTLAREFPSISACVSYPRMIPCFWWLLCLSICLFMSASRRVALHCFGWRIQETTNIEVKKKTRKWKIYLEETMTRCFHYLAKRRDSCIWFAPLRAYVDETILGIRVLEELWGCGVWFFFSEMMRGKKGKVQVTRGSLRLFVGSNIRRRYWSRLYWYRRSFGMNTWLASHTLVFWVF